MDVRRWGDRDAEEPARVVIERIGRYTYAVHVEHGASRYGPMYGQKVLRQYLSRSDVVERWEVSP